MNLKNRNPAFYFVLFICVEILLILVTMITPVGSGEIFGNLDMFLRLQLALPIAYGAFVIFMHRNGKHLTWWKLHIALLPAYAFIALFFITQRRDVVFLGIIELAVILALLLWVWNGNRKQHVRERQA